MSQPLKPNDPAYFLLDRGINDPSQRSQTDTYDDRCYICRDEEFSLMGLPLCQACEFCGAHRPADDVICKNGHEYGPGKDTDWAVYGESGIVASGNWNKDLR